MTHEPDEIDDEEHEEVAERVAAIDVAKASGMVCIQLPHELVSRSTLVSHLDQAVRLY